MSNGLSQAFASASAQLLAVLQEPLASASALPREVVRCGRCHLIQFRPVSDCCRRCASPLPPPPRLDFGLPGNVIVIEKKAAGSASSPSESSAWESVWYPPAEIQRQLALGPELKKRREERRLTQLEVATRAGLPRSYLSRIENSHLLPGPPIVQRLADALAVEVAELFAEEGNGGGNQDSEEEFWRSLLHSFAQLPPEQMRVVLSRARQMAAASEAIGVRC